MSTVQTAIDIRPFHLEIAEEALSELRDRIAGTRWPSRELVTDGSQGVQLATMKELARYWETKYEWRKADSCRLVVGLADDGDLVADSGLCPGGDAAAMIIGLGPGGERGPASAGPRC